MDDNGKNIYADEYTKNIIIDSYYAGELEISNCTNIFNLNMAVYIKNGNDNDYKFLMYFSQKENNINNNSDIHNEKIKNSL